MVKKFTIPFASQGDANDIPDALQVDGKVSFTQGFGYDYERPYDDPQAKDIAREDMNGLFKAITSAIGEVQQLGASSWSNELSYPKGAIVYHEKDLYISQVDDNQNEPPQSWTSIKNIADDSLKKAANLADLTDKATARDNLGLGSSATLNKTDVLGTSTSLVATQKLVNDTKINLENSKQDKLTFTGTGNVARMSEVNKKLDESKAFGVGQKWVDVTSQRENGSIYVNNTDKPIFVMVSFPDTNGKAPKATVEVDGVRIYHLEYDGGNHLGTASSSFFVPDGSTYKVTNIENGGWVGPIEIWAELR